MPTLQIPALAEGTEEIQVGHEDLVQTQVLHQSRFAFVVHQGVSDNMTLPLTEGMQAGWVKQAAGWFTSEPRLGSKAQHCRHVEYVIRAKTSSRLKGQSGSVSRRSLDCR